MLTIGVDKQGLAFIEPPGGGSAGSSGCGTGCGCSVPAPAFKRRENEPAYALLPPSNGVAVNQHGKSIRLADDGSPLAGRLGYTGLDRGGG